jgi:hypothetical protein
MRFPEPVGHRQPPRDPISGGLSHVRTGSSGGYSPRWTSQTRRSEHDAVEDPRAYIRLANHQRAQILAGSLKPGNPVTSIAALSQASGHSRQTIGKAMGVLVGEGLLAHYPGLGYFVVPNPGQVSVSADQAG